MRSILTRFVLSLSTLLLLSTPILASADSANWYTNGSPVPQYTCVTNYYVSSGNLSGPVGVDNTSHGTLASPYATIAYAWQQKAGQGVCINVIGPNNYGISGNYDLSPGGKSNTETGWAVLRAVDVNGNYNPAVDSSQGIHAGTAPRIYHTSNTWTSIRHAASYVIMDGFEVDGTASISAGSQCMDSEFASGVVHHIVAENNLVHDCGGGGFQWNHTSYIWLYNNAIHDVALTNGAETSGISVWEPHPAASFTATAYDTALPFKMIVAKNMIWHVYENSSIGAAQHTDGDAIIMDTFASSQGNDNNYTLPTLVYGNVACYNGGGGVQLTSGQNVTAANNSTYANYLDLENAGSWRGEGNIWNGNSINNTFINNIFQNKTSGPGIGSGGGSLSNNAALNFRGSGQTGNVATANISYPAAVVTESTITQTGTINSNPLYTSLGTLPSTSSNTMPCDLRPAAGSSALGRAVAAPYIPSDVTNIGAYQTAGGSSDTTAPSTPTNLSGTAVSSSQINLTWTASTDNVGVTGYKIFRNGTQVGTSATNSYSATGLSASTAYTYTVSAYDAAGNNSAQSSGISVTTPAGTVAPTVTISASPTSVTSGGSSTITWSGTNATSCTASGGWSGTKATSGSQSLTNLTTTATYTLACTGTGGTATQSATVTVTTGTVSTPYGGTAASIPGTIEAENYDLGGEGIAYHDTDTTNTLGAYRTEGVDIKTCVDATGCGYAMGYIQQGEWAKYTVNVTQAGSYTFTARVATINTGQTFHVEIDGTNVTGTIAVPVNETAWDTGWATVTVAGINLTAGQHVMRYVMDTNNFMDVNNFTWTTIGSTDTTPPSTPTGVSATSPSSSQLALTWTASTDNVGVTGYKIYRNGTQVGTSATNSYTDTGLSPSTVYSYTISAYDAAGNTSAQSGIYYMITQKAGATSISIGSRIVTTANLNVRSTASVSGTKLGTQPIGSLGTITSGPTTADGYTWWQINYDTNPDGWSVSNYLAPAAALSSPAVGMAQPSSAPPIAQLMEQVQQLFSQIQTLRAQTAAAGAAL